jgi:hypothetical protein
MSKKNALRCFFRPRLARVVLIQAQQVALKFRAVKRLDQRFRPLDHRAVASGSYYFCGRIQAMAPVFFTSLSGRTNGN